MSRSLYYDPQEVYSKKNTAILPLYHYVCLWKKALSFQWCGHMVVMIAPSLTVNSCHIVLLSRYMMKVENLLSRDFFRDLVFFFWKSNCETPKYRNGLFERFQSGFIAHQNTEYRNTYGLWQWCSQRTLYGFMPLRFGAADLFFIRAE